ncbi:MAG: DUF3791 domain-containing protein [Clostridiaceae bacterium]|nr:DUF3791 domain-containing protein [Clostridiaceae bacterium]
MDAIKSFEELEFAVFCIENSAIELGVSATRVYDAWTRKSNLLNRYVIPCFPALHTQGKGYIIDELLRITQEEGIEI